MSNLIDHFDDDDQDLINPEDTEPIDLTEDELLEVEAGADDDVISEVEIVVPVKKVNYLNNKDILKEIHKSKSSYSEFTDEKYDMYDVIVEELSSIFDEEVQERGKVAKAARLSAQAHEQAVNESLRQGKVEKLRPIDYKIDPSTISVDDLVFRVLTFEHIPTAAGRKKNPKSTADCHVKLNFHPFKHYIIQDGNAVEVGRSHSKNGKFSLDHGRITEKLAKMFVLMVDKYAQRGNWRGYSYIDEMKGHALLQLSQWALQFNEYKSDNPFAYYTASMSTGFTRVLNLEKRNQDLRDDLLIDSGASPSFSRQLEIEDEIRKLREDAINNGM